MSWNSGRVEGCREACAADTCWYISVHFPNSTQTELPARLETDGKLFSRQHLDVCARVCACMRMCLPSCHVSTAGEQINSRDCGGII